MIGFGEKDLDTCMGDNTVVGSAAVLLPARLGASPPPVTEAELVKLDAPAPTLTLNTMGGYTEPGCNASDRVHTTGGLLAHNHPTLPRVSTKVKAADNTSVTVTVPLVGAAPLFVTTME